FPPCLSRLSPHLAVLLVTASILCHVRSGLNAFIAVAIDVVVCPRSFSCTTPSWLTMKVMMPESPYLAGNATSARMAWQPTAPGPACPGLRGGARRRVPPTWRNGVVAAEGSRVSDSSHAQVWARRLA